MLTDEVIYHNAKHCSNNAALSHLLFGFRSKLGREHGGLLSALNVDVEISQKTTVGKLLFQRLQLKITNTISNQK